jgi:cobalt-zinc-cadmium efflux system membrane fusion protein
MRTEKIDRWNSAAFFLAGLLLVACDGAAPASSPAGDHADEGHDGDEAIVELSHDAIAGAGIRSQPARVGRLEDTFETTGRVDFNRDRIAHLAPRLPGRVHQVAATLGQQVREGEVLAVIESVELGEAKSSFLNKRARAELARRTYEREEGLYAERISSEQDMLAAEAAHRQAAAELATSMQALRLYGLDDREIAELQYEDTKASLFPIKAPFAGKITEKEVALGEVVSSETSLFTVADLSRVWVWIDVYERSLQQVSFGDGVEVRLDAYAQTVFRGQISYLGDEVDAGTRTLRARVDVENPNGEIRPGMFARVLLSSTDGEATVEQVMVPLVPDGAIQRDGARFIVFVPLSENRFERREVRPGRKAGGWVEILEGLGDEEAVVVEGSFLLKSEASKETLGGDEH